jgi:hypothetical protein
MTEESPERKAPYAAFTTFNNFITDLAKRPDMLPGRIDKSLMKGMSGGAQSQLLTTLRFFGLVMGENDKTDPTFNELVHLDDDGRREWMGTAFRSAYSGAMELSARNGTSAELAELFSGLYGHKGSTRDKAIRFFLQMAQHVGIEVSPHFAVPRVAPTTTRKRAGKRSQADNPSEHNANGEQQSPTGDTYQVTLLGGGTVTVTVAENHFNLSMNRTDRDFVNQLVDAMTDYAAGRDQTVEVSPKVKIIGDQD